MKSRSRYPWEMPVPVRKSAFKTLNSKHRALGIEVDLSAIETFLFDRPSRVRPEELLYCGHEAPFFPEIMSRVALGSGRAGRYKGKWLKGVGRTPLLMHWNRGLAYNSGVLRASSALRERFITLACEKRKLSRAIVPCEEILLRRVPRGRAFDRHPGILTVDRHLHALSVKPFDFARMSNFTWLLNHFNPSRTLDEFTGLLFHFLHPPSSRPPQNHVPLPRELISSLSTAFERGVGFQKAFFENGITFGGGARNNSAVDGRYLDLETGTYSGYPFCGILSHAPHMGKMIIGLDSISYFLAFSDFLWMLTRGLDLLADAEMLLAPGARIYAKEIAREIKKGVAGGALPPFPGPKLRSSWLSWYSRLIREQAPSASTSLSPFLKGFSVRCEKEPTRALLDDLVREYEMTPIPVPTGRWHERYAAKIWVPRGCEDLVRFSEDALHLNNTLEELFAHSGKEPLAVLRDVDRFKERFLREA